ncbi:Thimet oligopeptidase [Pseudolycoriella hygida]|uniref:Thimet oligopeptidase n=1 Tax=Pseudolycoriella hygida TaxID=35572 RepID=A0A9Q0N1P5_9DIPT|nr:Thimet oligopeptidase [Pseudolycoriella hygida]
MSVFMVIDNHEILTDTTFDACRIEERIELSTIVKTNSGPVRGKIVKTLFDDLPFYAFKGIPYAEAPLNKLRFKPPVPKKSWTDTLEASKFGNVCLQNANHFGATIIGSEDCLFLNIYTPDVASNKKRAVMFYIHGGGFTEGSGNDDLYGPDFLINEDVVVVTHNYRLGVLGFTSLGTSEYSGNMGLKDQNLALKWVKQNIEHFGGDPNRITIFGHSAGAGCTHYHVLSSETNSLFQRAIHMSGSAISYWARYVPGSHKEQMFAMANSTGTSLRSDEDLTTFLQNVDAEYFLKNFETTIAVGAVPRKELELLWGPVIEGKTANNQFIQMNPEDILGDKFNGKIDTMFGITSAEALIFIKEEINDPELLEPFDNIFQLQLTRNRMETDYDSDEYKKFAKEIRNFYFGENVRVSNKTLAEYNDLLSDLFFVYGIDQSVKGHAKNANAKSYYYRFSVDANLNAFKSMLNTKSLSGASHGDELCYLFRCRMFEEVYDNAADDSIEMNTIRTVTKLWTNFAKFGNPTPDDHPIEFKPVDKNFIHFVEITNEGLFPALRPRGKFMDFWTDLLGRYDSLVKNVKSRDELVLIYATTCCCNVKADDSNVPPCRPVVLQYLKSQGKLDPDYPTETSSIQCPMKIPEDLYSRVEVIIEIDAKRYLSNKADCFMKELRLRRTIHDLMLAALLYDSKDERRKIPITELRHLLNEMEYCVFLSSYQASTMTSKPNELPEGMQHNWDIKSWTERDIKNRLTEVLEIIRNLYDRAVQRLTFGHHWWHGTLGTPIVFPKLVSTSKEVRDAASEAGKEIDKLTLEMFSRKDIFQRLVEYKKTCDLDPEYMRFVDRMLTTGRRCGIQLEDEHRIPFLRVMNDINSLASEFEQNVIEDNCSVLLNADELDGLPDNFIKELKVDQETGLRTISIRSTCYLTLMQMCRNPKTRRKAFIAFENVGGGRNEEIMQEVIGKRQNCAYFLDYPNWAAYRQEILIAKNQETVNFFLNNLVSKIQPLWEAEQDALLKLKEDECNKYGYEFNGELYMWDIDYYANMFEEREYGINRDMVKEYFPLETVTNGMLGIYSHILGLNFTKLKDPPTWHEDVFAYKVSDKESGELMGYVYMDLYPRSGKFPHFATLPLQRMQHNWDIKSWTERDIKNRLTEVLEIIRNLYDRAGTADMADLSFETLLQPLLKVQRLTFGHHWWHGTLGTPIVFPKLVSTSKEVRDAASEAGKEIDKLTLEMFSRKDIFQRLVEYKKTCDLDPEYMRFVDRMLTTGRRCGVELEDEQQRAVICLMNDINSLVSEFEQNVIEDNCSVLLNADELDGLPDNFIKELKVDQETGLRTISISFASYLPLMQTCRNPKTRRKVLIAFENVGGRRNEEIMQKVIEMRHKCADLLGYENWAAYRQEMLIAKNPETVNFFLNNLVSKIQPLWEEEQDALLKLKEDECNKYGYEFNGELYMWDIDYYANMFEEREYGINRDMVKEYFPLETVTNGMLGIYSHILGLNFTKLKDPPTWHEDVFAYKVNDKESGELMGYVYMDLYPRSGKFPHFATLPLQSGALNENGIKEKLPLILCVDNKTVCENCVYQSLHIIIFFSMWKSWGHKAPTTASTRMRHNWNIKSWTAADIKNRLTEVLTKIRTLYDQAGTADMRNLSFSTLIDPLLDVQRLTFGYNWWYGTLGSTVVFPKLISVSKEVRDAATEAENAINELTLEMCARKDIFERLLAYKKFCKLQPENMRYVDRMITMAKRNGLELEDEQQSRLQELLNNINVLVSEFEQNVNEDKSFILLSDVELAGVHYLYIRSLDIDRESGLRKCTMNVSCYLPIMRKCRNAESRRKLNTAYLNVGGRRNEEIMQQVIAMRQECANLLGYENWAAYRLEMNMAKDTETVSEFLTTLASKLQPLWEREKAAFLKLKEEECKKFRYHFNNQLDAWDLPYYSNMLEEKKYAIDTDLIKVYFPLETVTNGMLGIYSHLLGVHFAKLVDPPTWHESVFVYKVNDKESGELMGYVYMDLFPRPGKFFHFGNIPMQSGALNENGVKDKTITCMVCNFTPPASDLPSLLTPADVEAYFHEFGHAMHVICCKAKNHIFWGLHVEMDFLEAPSQMLENWAKEKEVLSRIFDAPTDSIPTLLHPFEIKEYFAEFGRAMYATCSKAKVQMFWGNHAQYDIREAPVAMLKHFVFTRPILNRLSGHYLTGEKIEDRFLEKLKELHKMNKGYHSLCQLLHALFDQIIHSVRGLNPHVLYNDLMQQVMGLVPPQSTFPPGGYDKMMLRQDGRVYHRLYADIYGADMYETVFGKVGPLDSNAGIRFRNIIMETGGTREGMAMLRAFLGREPNEEAFLRSIDVFVYKVNDKESGELMGFVYMDLFPRPGKYSHFANKPMQSRALNENGIKEKTVTCKPSLLTPNEVKTFFHEFGHAMHAICSKAKVQMFWGVHVECAFVEAPSQMLENWVREKDVLALISGHFQTGEKIPDTLVDKIKKAENANAGYTILRQIVLATFDQRIPRIPKNQDGSLNP